MRRSNSSSNIPLPMSLQYRRDSKPKERSRSAVRNSKDSSVDNNTPLGRQRILPAGADRKYSVQKHLRTPSTPSTLTGFKRSNSLSSYRVSVARSKSPGDKKTLQKLINDKKWVAEQYSKVQHFILYSGLFDPELAGKIRPPTIAIFVEIISNLFRHIIKTAPINLQNYGDVVIQTLKLLRYPGPITPSAFKTINTMPGWPNFISIISWLIDRVNLQDTLNSFIEEQNEDVKAAFKMHEALFDFLSSTHFAMVSNADKTGNDELLLQSEDKLYADMLQITGTDHEAATKINACVESERAELESTSGKLRDIEEDNKKIQMLCLERQAVISKYEENKGKREQEIQEEIVHLMKAVNKIGGIKAALISTVRRLEDDILKQSCKYEEKREILNQIEEQKRVIERKKWKVSEYRQVKDKLDLELNTLVTKVESKVDNWNVFITKTFLPELKSLRLREKGFRHGFLEEIKKLRAEQKEVQDKLLQELQASHFDLENLLKQKESLIESNRMMDSERAKLDDLRKSVQILEEENKILASDIEDCKKNHEDNMKKIKTTEESKIEEQKSTIAELEDRKQKCIENIDSMAQKGLAIIAETHKLAIQNAHKIEEVMLLMVSDATTSLSKSKENLQKSFGHLLKLQETTAKYHEVFDEEMKENLPT